MDPANITSVVAPPVGVGQPAVITCTISSEVPPQVSWTGQGFPSGSAPSGGSGSYTSMVTIAAAAVEHRGMYCCRASTAANTAPMTQCGTLYVVGESLCHTLCIPRSQAAHLQSYIAVRVKACWWDNTLSMSLTVLQHCGWETRFYCTSSSTSQHFTSHPSSPLPAQLSLLKM